MKNDPNEIQFDCPKCQRPMSGDKALLGEMINCPDCGEVFSPAPAPASHFAPAKMSKAEKIRRLAENFTWAAAGLASIAVLMLFATVYSWRSETSQRAFGIPENQIGTAASDCWHITTWCIYAALLLFAIGQIIHIRANTEK